ncbi:MAG: hypothetical protein WBN51_07820, partial [Gammaproteobacteria bacterium]
MDARQQPRVTPAPALQPPGRSLDAAAGASANLRWLWAALAVLLLLGMAVIFALPGLVGPLPETSVPAEPLPPAGDTGALRDSAHRTLQAYLQLRARLELEHAGNWGEPDWSAAAARVTAGDRHFAQRQFAAAGGDYQAALDQLQQLDTNRSALLATALEEASRALAQNDVATASARFNVALALEPEHAAARRGLARAGSRTAVLEHMTAGETAEANGDLKAAGAGYRQAALLDADYAPAVAALQRVTGQIDARDFNAAMTRALAALD